MRKTIFAINTTIDGYCSHTDGIADEELHEYFTNLLRSAGTLLYGRVTYELMFPYWHTIAVNQSETPAENEFALTIDAIDKIVFSRTLKSVEMKNTTLSHAKIEDVLQELKSRPGKDIFIGSLSIASYLTHLGMIDEYLILVHPVMAGKGPRLFETDDPNERLVLNLTESKTLRSGVMALHYVMEMNQ